MEKTYITDPAAGLVTIRDPMIAVVGDTYYLTGTQPPYWQGENAGMHLWSSKDLKHFTHLGLIVDREKLPESIWCRDRFWAPELFTDGRKFYATFSCRNESEAHSHEFGVGLAIADRAEGPYTLVTVDSPLCGGIDGTFFQDDDGRVYLGANKALPDNKGTVLLLREYDNLNCTVSEPQLICTMGAPGDWDQAGVEGQCIVKRHGIYFQWYSSWGDGPDDSYYRAGIMTAPTIHGPWAKAPYNPVLTANEEYTCCGHNHSFQGLDGKDYVVFHALCRYDSPDDRKERMYIREVEYRADGTVTIK